VLKDEVRERNRSTAHGFALSLVAVFALVDLGVGLLAGMVGIVGVAMVLLILALVGVRVLPHVRTSWVFVLVLGFQAGRFELLEKRTIIKCLTHVITPTDVMVLDENNRHGATIIGHGAQDLLPMLGATLSIFFFLDVEKFEVARLETCLFESLDCLLSEIAPGLAEDDRLVLLDQRFDVAFDGHIVFGGFAHGGQAQLQLPGFVLITNFITTADAFLVDEDLRDEIAFARHLAEDGLVLLEAIFRFGFGFQIKKSVVGVAFFQNLARALGESAPGFPEHDHLVGIDQGVDVLLDLCVLFDRHG